MSNILKPKRGKKSTAIAQRIKLENGEIFFEMPETGVGTGEGNIKFGDGNTLYDELPYFFNKDNYAKLVHRHDMDQVNGLEYTLSQIEEYIQKIENGTFPVAKAEDSNRLGGTPAGDFVTITGAASLTNKTYNGFTLDNACAKDVDYTLDEDSTNLPTSKAVSTYVLAKMGEIVQIRYQVVTTLPVVGEVGVIYLVPHSHGTNDTYDEYIWIIDKYEKIGNTDIDLSDYARVDHNNS